MARRSGVDTAMLITGILMLILTISLIATVAATLKLEYITGVACTIQFGVAGWYLLTTILAIVSGASGHKCPYVSVIVISILAIFVALAACVVAGMVAFADWFQSNTNIPNTGIMSTTWFPFIPKDYSPLPTGVLIINCISFVVLIILSALSCCGTCCNTHMMPFEGSNTYVTTSGGYVVANSPPGYIAQPPMQQHNFQGMSNPNYENPQAANHQTAVVIN